MNNGNMNNSVKSTLEESLSAFHLYERHDSLSIKGGRRKSINYHKDTGPGATKFYLEIYDNKCRILRIQIEEDRQGKGLGRQLYLCIENFCKRIGLSEIRLTPTYEAEEFWKKMGFVEIGKYESVKNLV